MNEDRLFEPYANDILEKLLEDGFQTKMDLADHFDCSIQTIENRLRTLRKSGESIIHNQNGLKAITRQMIDDDPELGKTLNENVEWFLGAIIGYQRLMAAHKPNLPAAKRAINKLGYSREDRKLIAKSYIKVVSWLMYMEAQEDMD